MDLFGKDKLKQRIQELEQALQEQEQQFQEQVKKLEKQAKKASERARKASAEKQEVDKQLKKARTRIQTLKDQLEHEDNTQTSTPHHTVISLQQTLSILHNLDNLELPHANATSIYLPAEESPFNQHTTAFMDPYLVRIAILPPLKPGKKHRKENCFHTQPLHDLLNQRFCFIHVSAGGSGIALVENTEIIDSTIIQADVKSGHTKGGYSQKRFERVRKQQIDDHIEQLLPEAREILQKGFEHLILTGNDRLMEKISRELDPDTIHLTSSISKIQTDNDLKKSFTSALGCRLVHLSQEDVKTLHALDT